jgi:hypothetical protein
MKIVKLAVVALFVSLASVLSAQQVNLNQLAADVAADRESCAAHVEVAVRQSPSQVHEIVETLLAAEPELAEEIIFGAIAGMPTPVEEEVVARIVERAILFRPELATSIALGARRATVGMELAINRAAVRALRTVSTDPANRGVVPGQVRASAIPGVFVDGSILINGMVMSPARN